MSSVPDPANVKPWYLRNITEALALDEATGNVYIRTGITGDVIISGNVNIPADIKADVVTLGNVDISGNTIPATVYQGTVPWEMTNIGNDGKPWNLQVAQGLIPGVSGLNISGYGSNISTTFQPAWEGGQYTFLNSAQQLRVWSSSASDTDVSISVNGLDSNYIPQTEIVVLANGTTGVLTTKSFLRVNSISLTRTPVNIGDIRIGTSDKTITLALFDTGTDGSAGRSQQTVYTVPAGYTFYLTQSNWYTNQTGSQTALYRSWTRTPQGVVNIILTFPMQQQYNSTKTVPRAYPEKTDIQWQVASSSGSSRIGGQIEGYLIANA